MNDVIEDMKRMLSCYEGKGRGMFSIQVLEAFLPQFPLLLELARLRKIVYDVDELMRRLCSPREAKRVTTTPETRGSESVKVESCAEKSLSEDGVEEQMTETWGEQCLLDCLR